MPESTPTPVPVTQGQDTETRSSPRTGGGYRNQPHLAPFSLRTVASFTRCPPPHPDLTEPSLADLVHGLTLPSALASPHIAQEAVEVILDTHRAAPELTDAALLLAHDLVAYACGFTGAGEQLHLSLCSAENALQFTVYDTHAAHRHPRLAARLRHTASGPARPRRGTGGGASRRLGLRPRPPAGRRNLHMGRDPVRASRGGHPRSHCPARRELRGCAL